MSRQKSHSAKAPSQRQLRVGELIRHKLAELLSRGEIHDDVLAAHVITVPEVRLSPDLKLATVYIMPLGGADIEAVFDAQIQGEKGAGYPTHERNWVDLLRSTKPIVAIESFPNAPPKTMLKM